MSDDCAKLYRSSAQDFKKIPSLSITYWASRIVLSHFEKLPQIDTLCDVKQGLATGDNNRFLRLWYELSVNNESILIPNDKKFVYKWYPYNKGGEYRKWFGNIEYVVNWENDGDEIKHCFDDRGKLRSRPQNLNYFFKEGMTWSKVSTNSFAMRFVPIGCIFDVAGCSLFCKNNDDLYYILGFMNSKVINEFLSCISPTINYEVGHISSLPISLSANTNHVKELVLRNITISKTDWDSFETSWDFQTHPFLAHKGATLEASYNNWELFTASQFTQLKASEEELNRIFIDIYGLQDELNPEVKDEDVTIRKADIERDVKSFISYAVGCMFGRYSIDKPGLILANAGETVADYNAKVPNSRFEIDDDNIIPVLDDDYFHDDIVSRFREFLKVVYGKETLEQNMSFIAHALSSESKATPDKVLRDYFLKDFYADHLKIYQKRPIYWMFTSGKQQGFNALIYMHRYNKDTLGKIWGDYLRELEAKLDAEISLLENADKKNTTLLVKLKKQRLELKEYDADLDNVASEKIDIDLDDGVAVNYAKFGNLLRPLK